MTTYVLYPSAELSESDFSNMSCLLKLATKKPCKILGLFPKDGDEFPKKFIEEFYNLRLNGQDVTWCFAHILLNDSDIELSNALYAIIIEEKR